MTDAVFETERLSVRRWCESDLQPLLSVYGDADAMTWVGDGLPISHDECVHWLEVTRNNYQNRGYGMFAVELKDSAEVIGFCGLVHPGGQSEAEIKYAYLRDVWGKGYATEVVKGMINYAASVHKIRYLIATTAPQNIASHNVLLKAGMERGELRTEEDGSATQVFVWASN